MAKEVKNVVTTDMKSIREFRTIHETSENNAYLYMETEKMEEREAKNRQGNIGMENDRTFNKKVMTKKEKEIEKEKEKIKEFKETQEKMLEPSIEKQIIEEEGEIIEEVSFNRYRILHLEAMRILV